LTAARPSNANSAAPRGSISYFSAGLSGICRLGRLSERCPSRPSATYHDSPCRRIDRPLHRTRFPPTTVCFKSLDRLSRPPAVVPAGSGAREMERRRAAIVCADVAGYSRLMGLDEAGTHAAFKAHRSAMYPIVLNHGGRLVKNTGDGFMLEFPSIVGAIEAAIAMQALMAERNSQLPADRLMQFRLGVHMGDVMADEDDLFGDDVNIAARLETVAVPGGVAISAKACTAASKHLSATFVDSGTHR